MYADGYFLENAPTEYSSVSFIIPAHNEAQYIGKTLAAIQSAAHAVDIDYEIVVVNDASTDETPLIAAQHGAKVVDVELRNIGAVRNAGARAANQEWLIFLDADTLITTATLQQTLDSLASGYIGGGSRVAIDEPVPLPWFKKLMYYGVVTVWQVIGNWAAGCYMFCPKTAFDSFGGFDEEYFACEEYFFSKNLKSMGRFKLVQAPVITSARKLYKYSNWELVKFVSGPLVTFGSGLKSRRLLNILYADQR